MRSFFKKTVMAFVIIGALLLIVKEILMIHNQESIFAKAAKSTALTTKKWAVTTKQTVKEKPVKESTVKNQPAQKPVQQKQSSANGRILDVPIINQLDSPQLYNGCEVTSLAMILNYSGYHVTKNELANNIATVPLTYQNGLKGNPNVGFVGNMEVGPGYAVYNGPIYQLAKKYAGSEAVNLTNSSFSELLDRVSKGEPIWIITTSSFAPVSDFKTWLTPEGTVQISFSEHSVVITGYDENYIYINNPYGQKNEKLNRSTFEEAWEQMGRQAVVIEK